MKYPTIFLIMAALLISSTYSVLECKPEFSGEVTVRVIDQAIRPVGDAYVSIEYFKSVEDGRVETKPVKTGEDGTAKIHIFNLYPFDDSNLDCGLTVKAKFGTAFSSNDYIVGELPKILDVKINSYLITLNIVGEKEIMDSAKIVVNGTVEKKGEGKYVLRVGEGTNKIKIFYMGAKKEMGIYANSDRTIDVHLFKGTLRIKATNEFGEPIRAKARVGEKEVEFQGETEITVYGGLGKATIIHDGKEKTYEYSFYTNNEYNINAVFDSNPPKIENVKTEKTKYGKIRIVFNVSDPGGTKSSGLPPGSVRVWYRQTEEEPWKEAKTYVVEGRTFGADLPEVPDGEMFIKISATDGIGNEMTGTYSVLVDFQKQIPEIQKEEKPKSEDEGIDILAIVPILMAVFLIGAGAAFIYWKMKMKEKEEE